MSSVAESGFPGNLSVYYSTVALTIRLILWLLASIPLLNPGITITQNEAALHFPLGVTLSLNAQSDQVIKSVSLIYGTEGHSCQAGSAHQAMNISAGKKVALHWEWDFTRSGILPPGTRIWWQWEIIDTEGKSFLTDKKVLVIEDQRLDWHRLNRPGVTLQWVEGDYHFGLSLMTIAKNSLDRLSNEMGIRPTSDIWITVYASVADVREALLSTYEWAGGVAFPENNAIIISVAPWEMDWAKQVIPHEISHLVVGTLVFNCKGLQIPTWLAEGLARNAEGEISQSAQDQVMKALNESRLPPLGSLAGEFSAYSDEAALSYAQSGMVVNFLIKQYGPDQIGKLLATFQTGKTIDTALEEVYGIDTSGLDAAWRVSLGFAAIPTVPKSPSLGTTPTAIPTLPLWTSVAAARATPTPSLSPSPTITPIPNSPTATASPSPTLSPTTEIPREENPGSLAFLAWLGLGGFVILVLVVIVVIVVRKRR